MMNRPVGLLTLFPILFFSAVGRVPQAGTAFQSRIQCRRFRLADRRRRQPTADRRDIGGAGPSRDSD
jgi:hypothetical protein